MQTATTRPAAADAAGYRDMTWIPGNEFRMGSDACYPEERPVRRVAAERFWTDTRPVTISDLHRFVTATGLQPAGNQPLSPADSRDTGPDLLVPASLATRRTAGPVDLCRLRQDETIDISTARTGFRCVIRSGPLLAMPGCRPACHHFISVRISVPGRARVTQGSAPSRGRAREEGTGLDFDAVVVGSGPNGLAAAVTLTAAGLRVLVVEGAASTGGGCRTEELTLPGFWHDVCSTSHPLAVASPFFRRFDLPARGVRFAAAPVEFAHPLDGGRAAIVTRSVTATADQLGPDAGTYRRLFGPLTDAGTGLTDLLLSPVRQPPRRYSAGLATFAANGLRSAAAVARRFRTAEARGLLAGAAAHAMMPLSVAPSGAVGLMLTTLAHTPGWPFVQGGSARITDAMVDSITAGGGTVETGRWVRSLRDLPPARAVLLDVTARALATIAGEQLPAGYLRALRRFRYGAGVCKIDFALSGPVPWTSEACRQAGILHVGGSFEQIAAAEADVAAGRHPASPYVLVGQPGTADPSRAPAGRAVLWTYCHVPSGSDADMTEAVEAQLERFAPGFRDLVLARAVRTAADQEAHNPNYVGGDIAAGLQTLRQTIARPVARWNPYRTPAPGIYLCSSSTPPLPGVHGRCGELAALTALRDVFAITATPDLSPPAPHPDTWARA